jgi:hypothetical protein
MSWKKEVPILVRVLINDLGPAYTYSDSRLHQTIVVAAQFIQFDIDLDQKYVLNLTAPNITPDPTLSDPKDDIFIALLALKTACITDQSSYRTKATMEGIRAALGPASLSVSGNLAGWAKIIEHGACATYQELTAYWDIKNASAIRAILSPFVGNQFDPQNLNTPSYDHSRFEGNQYY